MNLCGSCGRGTQHIEGRCRTCGGPWSPRPEVVSYEQVLQHLLAAHGEHLRTTADPLSLGDFVTVNYVNPLYARAKDRPGRTIRFAEGPVTFYGGPHDDCPIEAPHSHEQL